MTPGKDLLDHLTDEQEQKLRDGEQVELLVEKKDPPDWKDGSDPQSMETVTIELRTKGTIGDVPLEEAFKGEGIQGLTQ